MIKKYQSLPSYTIRIPERINEVGSESVWGQQMSLSYLASWRGPLMSCPHEDWDIWVHFIFLSNKIKYFIFTVNFCLKQICSPPLKFHFCNYEIYFYIQKTEVIMEINKQSNLKQTSCYHYHVNSTKKTYFNKIIILYLFKLICNKFYFNTWNISIKNNQILSLVYEFCLSFFDQWSLMSLSKF